MVAMTGLPDPSGDQTGQDPVRRLADPSLSYQRPGDCARAGPLPERRPEREVASQQTPLVVAALGTIVLLAIFLR
jgi:hypothetical protein